MASHLSNTSICEANLSSLVSAPVTSCLFDVIVQETQRVADILTRVSSCPTNTLVCEAIRRANVPCRLANHTANFPTYRLLPSLFCIFINIGVVG